MSRARTILLTGATGYIGGRLAPRLLARGYQVRALARDPRRLQGRSWSDQVDIRQGDVLEPESLAGVMQGVDAAYYLIHSMTGSDEFIERDHRAAENFAQAAAAAGVKRIIYLGGLGDPDSDLSEHLRSRQMVGDTLRAAGVPVTEFRAAVIVGSGSLSFEMVRYLTERVPVMICPRWVFTRIQPIAVGDALNYLLAALDQEKSAGEIIEIGGQDVLTYGDMMLGYAEARGLTRRLIPVPALTPRLSSYWVHWVTPVPAGIARPLIEGLRNEVIVRSDTAPRLFPEIKPLGYQEAVELALEKLERGEIETIWSDALASSKGDRSPVYFTQEQGMLIERREAWVDLPPETLFRTFTGLGGKRGWLYLDLMWGLRGALDRLVGGVGMRRGRRHPDEIRAGDALDFWRVEAVEPGRLLRLRAEMKVPGKAWLQFEAGQPDSSAALETPDETAETPHRTRLSQTAFFAPKGLSGLLYWYALYPVHGLIFSGLIRRLVERAHELASQE